MPEIDVKGTKINYKIYEKGDIPIVYIPGATLDKSMWKNQIGAHPGTRSLMLDLPGHGLSSSMGPYTTKDLADYLNLMFQELEIEKPVLVGHSFGGAVAQSYAKKFPNGLSGLVLVDTFAYTPINSKILIIYLAQLANYYFPQIFTSGNLAQVVKACIPFKKKDAFEYALNTSRRMTPEEYSNVMRAINGFAPECPFPVNAPVMVIVGKYDSPMFQQQGKTLVEKINPGTNANKSLSIIPDSAHMPPYENPDAFNLILYHFLNGIAKQELLRHELSGFYRYSLQKELAKQVLQMHEQLGFALGMLSEQAMGLPETGDIKNMKYALNATTPDPHAVRYAIPMLINLIEAHPDYLHLVETRKFLEGVVPSQFTFQSPNPASASLEDRVALSASPN